MTEADIYQELLRVITLLTAAITNTKLYSPNHPHVRNYLQKAHEHLTHSLRFRDEITIFLVGEDVVADNRHLPASPNIAKFVHILRAKAIERITFSSGLAAEELQSLIQDLASTEIASLRSSACIKLGKVEIRVKDSDTTSEEVVSLVESSNIELNTFKELYLQMKHNLELEADSVDNAVNAFIKGFGQDISLMNELGKLKAFQEQAYTHAVNVGMLTTTLAETLGFTGDQLHQIGIASLLHDIGDLFIPDEIMGKVGDHLHQIQSASMLFDIGKIFLHEDALNAARRLTAREHQIIKLHAEKGALYLIDINGIPKLSALAALEHHIKYDGTGYPEIDAAWQPHLVSQMIAITDVFDAMPNEQSTKGLKPIEKIVWVLKKGKGTNFNPQLVDHFLKLIDMK